MCDDPFVAVVPAATVTGQALGQPEDSQGATTGRVEDHRGAGFQDCQGPADRRPNVNGEAHTTNSPRSKALLPHTVGPRLDLRALDLLGAGAAVAAQRMMVGGVVTAAVDRLAVVGMDDIGGASVSQPLQMPVERAQPDPVTLTAQLHMQVPGAAECLEARELVSDESMWAGGTHPRAQPTDHPIDDRCATRNGADGRQLWGAMSDRER